MYNHGILIVNGGWVMDSDKILLEVSKAARETRDIVIGNQAILKNLSEEVNDHRVRIRGLEERLDGTIKWVKGAAYAIGAVGATMLATLHKYILAILPWN